jgi:phosphotransferase system HPr (HPr) family protein
MEAIEAAYSEDGILILMDLGSAVLSTEMALNMVSDEMKANIRVCPAPFIEGAIAATVKAGLGADLASVYQEAMQALRLKTEQLSEITSDYADEDMLSDEKADDEHNEREITLTIPNAQGLHARPAVVFVKTVAEYDATVMIENLTKEKGPVAANSLISVMTLTGRQGDQVRISASGNQKDAVIDALIDLFDRNLEDEE